MPTKFSSLKYRARVVCSARLHNMTNFIQVENPWPGYVPNGWRIVARAKCKDCGMECDVTLRPRANETEICGPAVSRECKEK